MTEDFAMNQSRRKTFKWKDGIVSHINKMERSEG